MFDCTACGCLFRDDDEFCQHACDVAGFSLLCKRCFHEAIAILPDKCDLDDADAGKAVVYDANNVGDHWFADCIEAMVRFQGKNWAVLVIVYYGGRPPVLSDDCDFTNYPVEVLRVALTTDLRAVNRWSFRKWWKSRLRRRQDV